MSLLWYEIWIGKRIIPFPSAKEAYLYYLNNFATKEDFEYYRECAKKELTDVSEERIIGMIFENVFNEKHHIYKVKQQDGQIRRSKLYE